MDLKKNVHKCSVKISFKSHQFYWHRFRFEKDQASILKKCLKKSRVIILTLLNSLKSVLMNSKYILIQP